MLLFQFVSITMRSLSESTIPITIAEEAADWWLELQNSDNQTLTQQRISSWRQQSSVHDEAWQKIAAFDMMLNDINSPQRRSISQHVLRQPSPGPRRQLLKSIFGLAVIGSTPWFIGSPVTNQQNKTLATKIGEHRRWTLANGVEVHLNTDTIIEIDETDTLMTLVLKQGEIAIITHAEQHPQQQLKVTTNIGDITPIGTHFVVRQHREQIQVTLLEGQVNVSEKHSLRSWTLQENQAMTLTASGEMSMFKPNKQTLAWQTGMLIVSDMPLDTFVSELSRYHNAFIHYDPEVANLRVSGSYPTDDLTAVINAVSRALNLQYTKRFGIWFYLFEKK